MDRNSQVTFSPTNKAQHTPTSILNIGKQGYMNFGMIKKRQFPQITDTKPEFGEPCA